MKSGAHAAVSIVVAGLALALTDPPVGAGAVVAIALATGVGVDFDHFLLARYGGDWGALRRCLRNPLIVVTDQSAIFADGEVGALERLLSHAVIGGVAVPALWLVSPYVAGLVAVSLYAHVLADLVETTRTRMALERDDPRLE
jgi:hypothetical protein